MQSAKVISAQGWDAHSALRSLCEQLAPDKRANVDYHTFTRLVAASDTPILAFFNDFDSILKQSLTSDFGYMVKFLVDSGHTAVCAVAQRAGFYDSQDQLIPFPLISFFQELSLAGLKSFEARKLLTDLSRRSGESITEDESVLITTLLGTVPHRLQCFGFDLFSNPDFLGSSNGRRLDLLTKSIDQAANDYRDTFAHRVASDRAMTDEHWQRLIAVANDETMRDDPETHYLQKRGFLADDQSPFMYQGTLFRDCLRLIPTAKASGGSIRDAIARASGIAIDAAIKAAVSAAFG